MINIGNGQYVMQVNDLIEHLESIKKQLVNGGDLKVCVNGVDIKDFEDSINLHPDKDCINFN